MKSWSERLREATTDTNKLLRPQAYIKINDYDFPPEQNWRFLMLGIIEELLVSDPLYPQVLKKRTNFFFTQLPTYVAAPSATDIQGPLRWTREIGTQRLIVLPESMGTRVVRTGQYHRITHPLLSTIALDPVDQHSWTAACDVTIEAKLSIQHVMELGWKRNAVSGDLGWVC